MHNIRCLSLPTARGSLVTDIMLTLIDVRTNPVRTSIKLVHELEQLWLAIQKD